MPGSNERFLAKAPGLGADEYLLDLEDAVAPADKAAARPRVAAAARDADWGDAVLAVRVNGWESPWTYLDVIDGVGAAGPRLDTVILPKVQRAAEVVALDLLLSQVERSVGLPAGQLGIEPQIETAAGLVEAASIASASPRVEALVLGPVDMAASLGLDELPDEVLVRLLVAGRAAGVAVVDGPYVGIRDPDGLRASAGRARRLGFDGKWSVHPDQIGLINDAFTPTRREYDAAHHLLRTYAGGAVVVGAEMVDEATRRHALAVVARGDRAGLHPPAGSAPE